MREIVTKRFRTFQEYLEWKEKHADIREARLDINAEGQVTVSYLITGEIKETI